MPLRPVFAFPFTNGQQYLGGLVPKHRSQASWRHAKSDDRQVSAVSTRQRSAKWLVELLESAVGAPVHALGLGRKAVVQSQQFQGKAASFLDPSANVPTAIGGCQGGAQSRPAREALTRGGWSQSLPSSSRDRRTTGSDVGPISEKPACCCKPRSSLRAGLPLRPKVG